MKIIYMSVFSALLAGGPVFGDVTLPHVFSDHAVLQRDGKAPVWGTASAGEKITVSIAGQTVTTVADAAGAWRVELNPLKAGGPYRLTVNAITREDILVGDVWLCAGQSNMGTTLAGTQYWMTECPAADLPEIRLLALGGNGGYAAAEPQRDVPDTWQPATPVSAFSFSAVGWFFAKEIHNRLGVPVGVIKASAWGAPAEPFVARAALATMTNYTARLQKLDADMAKFSEKPDTNYPAKLAAYDAKLGAVQATLADQDAGLREHWEGALTNLAAWAGTRSGVNWDALPEFKGQAGSVWYRRELDLIAAWAGHDLDLWLGGADGETTVYFNGERLTGDATHCRVPGRLTQNRRNAIVVRVVSFSAPGRLGGLDFAMYLAPVGDQEGQRLPLGGDWKYRPGYLTARELRPPPVRQSPAAMSSAPGALYNGMIAPLAGYALRGVLWYQGESNADRASEYRDLIALLVGSWRKAWGADWDFLLVQLPNFVANGQPKEPGEPALGWAPIREAQLNITKTVPKTGMAVTIDCGDPFNIHPDNKRTVGLRLARAALGLTYGLEPVYSGPIYDSVTVKDGKARVKFRSVGGGLVAAGELRNFTIAGADKTFLPAKAQLEGDEVVVSSSAVAVPTAVRYAFWNNPDACNLFNKEGLPASPFRTDDWELPVAKRK